MQGVFSSPTTSLKKNRRKSASPRVSGYIEKSETDTPDVDTVESGTVESYEVTVNKKALDEVVPTVVRESEGGVPVSGPTGVEPTGGLTLSNCLEGLSADIDKLLKISPKKEKSKERSKGKRLSNQVVTLKAAEEVEEVVESEFMSQLPISSVDQPSTLYYDKVAQNRAKAQTGRGPMGVSVREGGSASAKWPSGSTAVSFTVETGRPSISAFFPSGELAVMIDTRGCGSANYSTGKTAMSSTSSGGMLCSSDGTPNLEWSNKTSLDDRSMIDIGEGLGMVCNITPKQGLFVSLIMKVIPSLF